MRCNRASPSQKVNIQQDEVRYVSYFSVGKADKTTVFFDSVSKCRVVKPTELIRTKNHSVFPVPIQPYKSFLSSGFANRLFRFGERLVSTVET